MGSDLFNSSLHVVIHFVSPGWCAEKMKKNKNVFHQTVSKEVGCFSIGHRVLKRFSRNVCVKRQII
jgi:hypothetical protein